MNAKPDNKEPAPMPLDELARRMLAMKPQPKRAVVQKAAPKPGK